MLLDKRDGCRSNLIVDERAGRKLFYEFRSFATGLLRQSAIRLRKIQAPRNDATLALRRTGQQCEFYLFLAGMLFASLALGGTSSTHSDRPELQDRVAVRNGTKANFPWAGKLVMHEKEGDALCSATLLPEKSCVILSANHCMIGTDPSKTDFVLGQNSFRLKDQKAVHPVPSGQNIYSDLVLIELDRTIPVPSPVPSPFSLARERTNGRYARMVGYGELNGDTLPEQSHEGEGEITAYKKFENGFDDRSEMQMVIQPTREKSQTNCPGDSGGPTLSGDGSSLIGVISTTEDFLEPDFACVRPEATSPVSGQACPGSSDAGRFVKAGPACLDTASGLSWYSPSKVQAQPPFALFERAIRKLYLEQTGTKPSKLHPYDVARYFCEYLNSRDPALDRRLRTLLKKALAKFHSEEITGDPPPSDKALDQEVGAYFSQALPSEHSGWRLPSARELGRIVGKRNGNRGGYDVLLTESPNLTFWAESPGEGPRKTAIAVERGDELSLSRDLSRCDRVKNSISVSVGDHWRQIKEILDQIQCPEAKPLPKPLLREPDRRS